MIPLRVETPEDRVQARLERVLHAPRGVSRGGSRQAEPESESEPQPEPDLDCCVRSESAGFFLLR